MAVKIRLRRMGAKKSPFYRIVVADSRYPRDGRFIEEIGFYNPLSEPVEIKVDSEKAKKWISNGAQPTDTVRALWAGSELDKARPVSDAGGVCESLSGKDYSAYFFCKEGGYGL